MMGQNNVKDTIQRVFYGNEENFAEVFNKSVFTGNEIKPSELSDADSSEHGVIEHKGYEFITHLQRDVIKKMCRGNQLLLLAIENTTYIDYAIPLKVFNYCCVNYNHQVMRIRDARKNNMSQNEKIAHNNEEKNNLNMTSDEYLSRLMKTDKLTGIVTLVIYYGENEWDGPLSLCDMMELSDNERELVSDFKLAHFIDVMRLTDEQLEAFEGQVKILFGFLRYKNDIEKLIKFVNKNKELLKNIPDTTRLAVSVIGDMKDWESAMSELLEKADKMTKEYEELKIYRKEGEADMKNLLLEIRQYGVNEGKKLGLKLAAVNMLKAGKSIEDICIATEMSEEEIKQLELELKEITVV